MGNALPSSQYEYYTCDGITRGLSADQPNLLLNGKNFTIYGAEMDYHRVPPNDWSEDLQKARAAGLNTITVNIPWNVHQFRSNSTVTNFGAMMYYFRQAQKADLFTIAHIGPFNLGDYDYGGLPSWLLHDKDNPIRLRTSDPKFMQPVRHFFAQLLPLLAVLQFSNGGSIIAFQIENNYGRLFSNGSKSFAPDRRYLTQLKQMVLDAGIKELLVTQDSPTLSGNVGTLPDFFQTVVSSNDATDDINVIKQLQPGRPIFIQRYHAQIGDCIWGRPFTRTSLLEFRTNVERILQQSISIVFVPFRAYTVHLLEDTAYIPLNGTENDYRPHFSTECATSLLTTDGSYTEYYEIAKDLVNRYAELKTKLPPKPCTLHPIAYPMVPITEYIPLLEVIDKLSGQRLPQPVAMETLDINLKSGQSHGYIIYETNYITEPNTNITVTFPERISDAVFVFFDRKLIAPQPLRSPNDFNGFGYWRLDSSSVSIPSPVKSNESPRNITLHIMVESLGRIDSGLIHYFDRQYKGIYSQLQRIRINENNQNRDWLVKSLDFQSAEHTNFLLTGWKPYVRGTAEPGFYRASFSIRTANPRNTYLDMRRWNKGIVLTQGLVIGRYMNIGPPQTLFFTKHWFSQPQNEIIVFEHFLPDSYIAFSKHHILFLKN